MPVLTLTSKRQATFPKETCESLGLKPGDLIELEPRDEGGKIIHGAYVLQADEMVTFEKAAGRMKAVRVLR